MTIYLAQRNIICLSYRVIELCLCHIIHFCEKNSLSYRIFVGVVLMERKREEGNEQKKDGEAELL